MKTIKQALIDEIHFPLNDGFIDNKLILRNLDSEDAITREILLSKEFIGAVADCLYSLIDAPNISESGISISIPDRTALLRRVNDMYRSIGEEERRINQPNIYIES